MNNPKPKKTNPNIGSGRYLIVSNRFIRPCIIVSQSRDFSTVKFTDGGGIRVRNSRLYKTRPEAEAALKKINPGIRIEK